ncbi:MAG: hypothetical protein IKA13_08430 [Bacteroidales bacterium]|nr:hypothetical protein [Bacteroidales bacterium]
MYRFKGNILIAGLLMILALASCSTRRQLKALYEGQLDTVLFNMPKRSAMPNTIAAQNVAQDTIIIKDAQGNEQFLMKAVQDEETGEMVATEVLEAATVTARFQNIAERRGKVDLEYLVTVPENMLNNDWQFRLYPSMVIQGDSTDLEAIFITGRGYREAQLRGYERYDRFIRKIVEEDIYFVNIYQFERFVARNFPDLYAFKTDSTYVSEETFQSYYGVEEQEAIEHYTQKLYRKWNNSLKAKRGKKYEKLVKSPIITEGVRLDSIITKGNGDVVYHYVQTINTRPKLRKATINLKGSIYQGNEMIYLLPNFKPLDYYISTTSTFADLNVVKYLTQVIERRAYANTAYKIDFKVAKSDVDPQLGNNAAEIEKIKANLRNLLDNEEFELDSIIVNATASPEGTYVRNGQYAQARSESVTRYFDRFIKEYRDSLEAANEEGFSIVLTNELDSTMKEDIIIPEKDTIPEIRLTARSTPENWDDLLEYVREDTVMTDDQKQQYFDLHGTLTPDARENQMKKYGWYSYAKKEIYPKLRTVKFNFYLHRKGMVKDTIHTTTVDSTYARGLQALADMDYHTAIALLGPYEDYNAAVAFVGLDRNLTALQILEPIKPEERTPQVNYILAIIYSRIGRVQDAVQCYLNSVEQEPSYRHRGNLDPEISVLIKQYELFKEEEEIEYW